MVKFIYILYINVIPSCYLELVPAILYILHITNAHPCRIPNGCNLIKNGSRRKSINDNKNMKIATINNNNDATYRWGLQGCIGKWHLTTKAAAACWENETKKASFQNCFKIGENSFVSEQLGEV